MQLCVRGLFSSTQRCVCLFLSWRSFTCRVCLGSLEMVDLTDACVGELCEAVAACGSLTILILKNNNLTDVSVPRLIELVQGRPVLELK